MNDRATDAETSVIDVRTREFSDFEDGEAVRVHYRDAADEPHKTLTGRITTRYSDRKVLLTTEEGRRLTVNLRDVTENNIRDFDTGEEVGRGMFAETAYHVEKDGEDLREELLGDDSDDSDDSDEDGDGAEVAADGGEELENAEDTEDLEEGDKIAVTHEIANGPNAGDTTRYTATVTNAHAHIIQFRPPGAKGTSAVSLRSGAVHKENSFRDVLVGRHATVTRLPEGDDSDEGEVDRGDGLATDGGEDREDPEVAEARRLRRELLLRDDVTERTKDHLRGVDVTENARSILSFASTVGLEVDVEEGGR